MGCAELRVVRAAWHHLRGPTPLSVACTQRCPTHRQQFRPLKLPRDNGDCKMCLAVGRHIVLVAVVLHHQRLGLQRSRQLRLDGLLHLPHAGGEPANGAPGSRGGGEPHRGKACASREPPPCEGLHAVQGARLAATRARLLCDGAARVHHRLQGEVQPGPPARDAGPRRQGHAYRDMRTFEHAFRPHALAAATQWLSSQRRPRVRNKEGDEGWADMGKWEGQTGQRSPAASGIAEGTLRSLKNVGDQDSCRFLHGKVSGFCAVRQTETQADNSTRPY